MWSGRSERQKQGLADAVTQAVVTSLGYGEESVSVSIEEFQPSEWTEKVFEPDIQRGAGKLYKRPGYGPSISANR
jgi:4-oxalocrotonate tautomerase